MTTATETQQSLHMLRALALALTMGVGATALLSGCGSDDSAGEMDGTSMEQPVDEAAEDMDASRGEMQQSEADASADDSGDAMQEQDEEEGSDDMKQSTGTTSNTGGY